MQSAPMPAYAMPRVTIRSALVDLSSRSETPFSGGLGAPSTAGAMPVGRLPLHNVVMSRLTARSPSPSTALDREDHPRAADFWV